MVWEAKPGWHQRWVRPAGKYYTPAADLHQAHAPQGVDVKIRGEDCGTGQRQRANADGQAEREASGTFTGAKQILGLRNRLPITPDSVRFSQHMLAAPMRFRGLNSNRRGSVNEVMQTARLDRSCSRKLRGSLT